MGFSDLRQPLAPTTECSTEKKQPHHQ